MAALGEKESVLKLREFLHSLPGRNITSLCLSYSEETETALNRRTTPFLTSWQTTSFSSDCCSFFFFFVKEKKNLPHSKRAPVNHPSLNLNESLSLLATGLPCLVLVHLKWFWLGFRLFITSPQISVDPHVWVLKSTTCFLMRCQGDTQQEQRTGGRPPQPRCRGEPSPALIFFFFLSFLQKQTLPERKLFFCCCFFLTNTSCLFYICLLWKKKTTRGNNQAEKAFFLSDWEGLLCENQYCLISLYGSQWTLVTNFTEYETI